VPLLVVSLFVTGCNDAQAASNSAQPPMGRSCTVQFRRDALGAAANLPMPPTTDNINGSVISISGTLSMATEEWVVLQTGKEIWIPKSVVLLIKYQ
jgi:hypothetical protein